MSYILDALKKSEQERKQPQRPGAIDLEGSLIHLRRRRTPGWAYALGAVLLLNVLLIAGLYVDRMGRHDTEASSASVSPIQRVDKVEASPEVSHAAQVMDTAAVSEALPAHAPQNSMPESSAPIVVPGYEAHQLPPGFEGASYSGRPSYEYQHTPPRGDFISYESPGYEASNEYRYGPQEQIAEGYEYIAPSSTPTHAPDPRYAAVVQEHAQAQWDMIAPKQTTAATPSQPMAPPRQAPIPASTVLAAPSIAARTPLLQEMDRGFVQQVPAIGFNSHIYSSNPEARRVMINNIYLREGEGFSGVVVKEIGEQYVVFEMHGRHFKLPVMKDWQP